MTKTECEEIQVSCGLAVENVRISEELFAQCVRDSDEAGPWYEDYKQRMGVINE